jgi:hypothetical protein
MLMSKKSKLGQPGTNASSLNMAHTLSVRAVVTMPDTAVASTRRVSPTPVEQKPCDFIT